MDGADGVVVGREIVERCSHVSACACVRTVMCYWEESRLDVHVIDVICGRLHVC